MTLESANTLSGSVVRILRGGEGLPKMFCLVTSSLGHLHSQCSIVSGSSLQGGHRGSAEGSRRLAKAFSNGVWPARSRARRTASARLLVAMQPLDQENPRICRCGSITGTHPTRSLLVLLLLRYSAKSSIAQGERMATRLHLPHAHLVDVIIPTPGTAGSIGVLEQ